MKTLITFIGTNDVGKLENQQDGAILNLLSQFHVDSVHLLFNSNGITRNGTKYSKIANYLFEEIAARGYCYPDNIKISEIFIEDITDHTEIYNTLLNYLKSHFITGEGFDYFAAISSGTPAMQTAWILIAETDKFPITLLKSIEKHYAKDNRLYKEVKLITGVKEILQDRQIQFKNKEKSHSFIVEDPTQLNDLQLQIAKSNHHILIQGETGTGKEVLANTIHKLSGRKGRLIPLNCAGLPDTLLESELFGHVKGAFTGADREKKGIVEEFADGTLFLDEINSIPLPIQAKLLRFLDKGEYRMLGSNQLKKSNIRVISASNENLRNLVEKKVFRSDLYYRLSTFELKLLPLRNRKHTIPEIIKKINPNLKFSNDAMDILLNYNYPGNVRELKIILDRLDLISKNQIVTAEYVRRVIDELTSNASLFEIEIPQNMEGKVMDLVKSTLIKVIYEQSSRNALKTGKILGVSHPTVLKVIKDNSK